MPSGMLLTPLESLGLILMLTALVETKRQVVPHMSMLYCENIVTDQKPGFGLPPNKPMQLTPLCGPEIGAILTVGNTRTSF